MAAGKENGFFTQTRQNRRGSQIQHQGYVVRHALQEMMITYLLAVDGENQVWFNIILQIGELRRLKPKGFVIASDTSLPALMQYDISSLKVGQGVNKPFFSELALYGIVIGNFTD